jgi:hypothetical protein
LALCLFGGDIPDGGMKPLTIIVSFDVGEQVVPGGIPGWLASQVHEFGFQSAEATFNRGVIPAISLPAHGLDHPGGAENLAVIRRRRIGCRDLNGGADFSKYAYPGHRQNCQKGLLAVLTVHGVWAFPEFLPSTSPGIPSLEASWIDAIGKEPVEVTKKVQPGLHMVAVRGSTIAAG